MNARTKLRWVDIPGRSLREGLACGQGGVQVLLMVGDERQSVAPSGATSSPDVPAAGPPADKPH
jgi:hypothetical protein